MIHVRPKRLLPVLSLLVLAGCGGSDGGLLATVPPPVEFAGLRVGGINELPAAGTYVGTLKLDRATYRFDDAEGEWALLESIPLAEDQAAEAIVAADGSIVLRRTSSPKPEFKGTLRISADPLEPTPTATLTSADGTTALYPYSLRNGPPSSLAIAAHGKVSKEGAKVFRFDRYTFDLSASP